MVSPPKRVIREFLDTPGQDRHELEGLLGDIRRTNRRFGGYPLVLGYLRRFIPRLPPGPITVLDVATASADVPRAIASWARAQDLLIRIVALDLSKDILALAASGSASYPEVTLLRGNALALPFPDRAIDVVMCGLALHHFTFEDASRVLREINRVARGGFIVNDIERSWGAYLGALLDTRLFTRNRLARHDGPLSVLRSFTVREVRAMVAAAGVHNVDIRRHPWFRIAIVRWPDEPSGVDGRRAYTEGAVARVHE
jgi:ubiquinone/menaquinone biosynthesis C-methylase UbiE